MTTRKHYDSRIKAQVALEALKNQQTIAKIASEYGVHPNLVTQWKQRLLAEIPDIFSYMISFKLSLINSGCSHIFVLTMGYNLNQFMKGENNEYCRSC